VGDARVKWGMVLGSRRDLSGCTGLGIGSPHIIITGYNYAWGGEGGAWWIVDGGRRSGGGEGVRWSRMYRLSGGMVRRLAGNPNEQYCISESVL
jgi:hypothetical protein